jgi:hypothetical protein
MGVIESGERGGTENGYHILKRAVKREKRKRVNLSLRLSN